MANRATVTLTKAQARVLLLVAENGYGDGDFFGLNDPHDSGSYGNRRDLKTYINACNAINKAFGWATQEEDGRHSV